MPIARRDLLFAPALLVPGACALGAPSLPAPGQLGAYTGNDPADALRFRTWLGRAPGLNLVSFNQSSWDGFASSIPWIATVHGKQNNVWSVPLACKFGTLTEVVTGLHDKVFATCAAAIDGAAPAGPVLVRIGWEMNLKSQEQRAFTASGAPAQADWIAAYRRVVSLFRQRSSRFRFIWCPNVGAEQLDPETCWPGADVVDVVGLDIYFNSQWDKVSDGGASIFAWRKIQPGGLDWLVSFARRQGKPFCLGEWGVNDDRATAYMASMIAWIQANKPLYQAYWDSNAGIMSQLSAGRLPTIARLYRQAFGA